MSSVTLAWSFTHEPLFDLSPPQRAVVTALADHAWPDGSNAFPSIERIGKMTSLSRRTIQTNLRALEDLGVIEATDQHVVHAHRRADHAPTNYRLNLGYGAQEMRPADGAQQMRPVEPDAAQDVRPETDHGAQQVHERGAGDAHEPRTGTTTDTSPSLMSLVGSDEPQREEIRLANLLADLVAANGYTRPNVTLEWTSTIERMIRLDRRTPQEVEGAIRWASADDFWSQNVRSPKKLRQHFETMRARAARQQPRGISAVEQVLREEGVL